MKKDSKKQEMKKKCSSCITQEFRGFDIIKSGIRGVAYNFTNQNLVSFEDNIDNKGDLPLVTYMDFETTACAQNFLTPEQNKMFAVSYTLMFAFHPKLNLNRVILQRSLGHSLSKLATVDYLNDDKLKFVDKDSINQLKDCAINVSERRCKSAVAQMFAVELRFPSNCLLKWFNRKFKIQIMEIDHKEKFTCEAFNLTDWKKRKCVICNFPLIINAKGPNVPANEISYTDFYIKYAHKFLRKIYSKEELETSKELNGLESYYEVFDRFLSIVILLKSAITNCGAFSETSKE